MNDLTQNRYLQSSLSWIKENYIKIILVFLLLSLLFSWIFYRNFLQEENSKEASILFDEFNFILNNENIDLDKLSSLQEKTKKDFPDQIYSILMNLELSQLDHNSNNFQDSLIRLREVNTELEKRGNETSFLKDLSRLRLALLLLSENELIEAKEVLDKDFTFFQELKYEFLGDLEIKSLNNMAAKENYETALDLSSSEIHRELIKIKLSTVVN